MDRLLSKVWIPTAVYSSIRLTIRLFDKLLPGSDLGQDVDKLLEEVDVPPALLRNDDETDETMRLTGKLSKLDLNPPQNRFFGKSRCLTTSCHYFCN